MYIYKTTNLINNKIYIGQHNGKRKSYIGTGKLISEGRQKNKKLDWNNKQTKPVIQETKIGKFIRLWASAYQVEKEIGLNSSHISSVCRNLWGFKTHGKYKWRFATQNEIIKDKSI